MLFIYAGPSTTTPDLARGTTSASQNEREGGTDSSKKPRLGPFDQRIDIANVVLPTLLPTIDINHLKSIPVSERRTFIAELPPFEPKEYITTVRTYQICNLP